MIRIPMLIAALGGLLLPLAIADPDDWTQWRGPEFRGTAEASGLPVTWSTTENVAWSTELPGQSAATPVTFGERIFLASLDDETQELLALGLDRTSGEILWKRTVGEGRLPSPRSRGRENTLAASSPVTDGRVACFLYGTGDLVAFDMDGAELWKKNLAGPEGFSIGWGYASSPLLYDGRLYVEALQRGESWLAAFDPQTGEQVFRVVREHTARAESPEAYTTPIPFKNGERDEILVLGADCLTAHDPATGKEYWRWSDLNPRDAGNFRTVSSPVVGEDGRIFVTSPQHNPMHGLQVDGELVTKLWQFDKPTPDSTTPLYYQGRLYAVDGRNQRMVCLDPESGELIWQGELETPSFLRASPTGADGKIYVMDAEGQVVVLEAGDEFRVLARNDMGSYPSRATPIIDDNQLLIRTADRLYCIGAPSEEPDAEDDHTDSDDRH